MLRAATAITRNVAGPIKAYAKAELLFSKANKST